MSLTAMSITGGVMILATVIIRMLGLRKLPKATFTALWTIITLRLLIPFSLPFEGSVYTMLTNIPGRAKPGAPIDFSSTDITFYSMARAVGNTQSTTGTAPNVNPLIIIWLSGAALFALYFAFSYFRIRRRFSFDYTADCRDAMLATGIKILRPVTVYVSSAVEVPLTYGILRPVIMLPKSTDLTDTERMRAVLAHEMVHIKRFHAVFKLLLITALCVHWFNPLVWVMLILANRDIELLCDETVLQTLGTREKQTYARVLLEMEEQKAGLIPMFNSFSKYALEERICSIMSYKRISAVAIVFALALIVGVTAAFATSGKDEVTEPETVITESIVDDASADELVDLEQELADAEQILADAEQALAEKEQEAMQELADIEQELAGAEPQLVAVYIGRSETVTGEDGVPVTSPVELQTIYIPFEDTIGETDGMFIATVSLPNSDCMGFGSNTEGIIKHMVLDYLDGKVAEGVITQDEAEIYYAQAMQNVTFESLPLE